MNGVSMLHKRSLTLILPLALCLSMPLHAFDDVATQDLISAIKAGSIINVKKSIEADADVNAQIVGEDKETPLMLALRELVFAFQKHHTFLSPWSLSIWGSIATFVGGAAGFIHEQEKLEPLESPSNKYYISIGVMVASLAALIANPFISAKISDLSKRDVITGMLLANPSIDVSLKNKKGETVLNILDSYKDILSRMYGKYIPQYDNIKKAIESKLPPQKV
jgi:hypothetical protein